MRRFAIDARLQVGWNYIFVEIIIGVMHSLRLSSISITICLSYKLRVGDHARCGHLIHKLLAARLQSLHLDLSPLLFGLEDVSAPLSFSFTFA